MNFFNGFFCDSMIKMNSIKIILVIFTFMLIFTNSIVVSNGEISTQGVVDSGEEVQLTYWLTIYAYYGQPGAEEIEGNIENDLTTTVNGGMTIPAFDAELIGMKIGVNKQFIVDSSDHSYTGQLENQDLYYIVRINAITNDDSAPATNTNTDTNTGGNSPQAWDELNLEDLVIPGGILAIIIGGISVIYLSFIREPQNITKAKEATKISSAKQREQLSDLQGIIAKKDISRTTSEKPERKIKRR